MSDFMEAPPVIRRREKNKRDNSSNRRSRPASWFVSHFGFDKLFHRGRLTSLYDEIMKMWTLEKAVIIVLVHVISYCNYILKFEK